MEHLDPPDALTWDERRLWFEAQESARSEAGVGALSEQACALMIDLQAAYCAGAWSAVVILAAAIVDAQSFHAGFPNDATAEERRWLRGLRNSLLHEDRANPALTIEDHWTRRGEWEKRARRAVLLAFDMLQGESAVGRSGRRGAQGRR